jgi:shikimate kinase
MNIVLIGMSGVGKSFIGKRLAEDLEYEFVDIDSLIENRFGKPLQEILDELGDEKFIEAEREEVLKLNDLHNTVISPGGSVVYSQDAIMHLKSFAKIVYLTASAQWISSRINSDNRGIVGLGEQNFEELHGKRDEMYAESADVQVNVEERELDEILKEIKSGLNITTYD